MNSASERVPAYQAELTLQSSAELPRMLELRLTGSTLYADVSCQNFTFVSNANGLLSDCYLDISAGGFEFLSIDRACFRICEAEVTQIRAVLEPLGLQVREAS